MENNNKLIIGLGNPGDTYKNNRHNIGFKVIDSLCKKLNVELDKEQFNGKYAVVMINNFKTVIAKPMTYMNLSGDFVSQFSRYYNVDPKNIVIIHDDIDTKVGEIKLRTSGSSGGQNGVKDIINKLHTEEFKRIKVGIGPKPKNIDLAKYVLSNFTREERDANAKVINLICQMILKIYDVDFSNLLAHVSRK